LRRGKLTRLTTAEAWAYVEDLDERLSSQRVSLWLADLRTLSAFEEVM
jgi:hypothetical protein